MKNVNPLFRTTFGLLGLAIVATTSGQTAAEDPDDLFVAYDIVILDLPRTAQEVREQGHLTLTLNGRPVSFVLEPYSVRSADYALFGTGDHGEIEQLPPPESTTFRAFVEGGGEARFLVSDDRLSGLVDAEDDWYFIEPLSRFRKGAPAGAVITYRQQDILPDERSVLGLAPRMDMLDPPHAPEDTEAGEVLAKQGVTRLLEVATEADALFTSANGGTVNGASQVIEGIVNDLDYLYTLNLSIKVRLTAQFVAVGAGSDPYDGTNFGHGPTRFGPFSGTSGNDSCVPVTGAGLWEQFRSFWNANRGGIRRDVAVLFTGRDLKLCATVPDPQERELFGTAGQIGTVCQFPGRSYVVMEQYALNSAGLMAHEIGHSIGAHHDTGSQCPGDPQDWVMCGTVRADSTLFSSVSKGQVSTHLNLHGACVDPPRIELQIPAGDIYHFSAPTPPNVARVEQLTIRNRSSGTPLQILNASNLISGACFQQTSSPATIIQPGGSSSFNVRLLCSTVGFKLGSISVASDDPATPNYAVTLRGQVKSGTVHNIALQASFQPSFGAVRSTVTSYAAHPADQISFYFDPNKGIFEGRPGGPCFGGVENPSYFKVRRAGALINACRFQASWDPQEIVCNQAIVDALNAGTEFVINTDDMLSEPGNCKLQQPLQPHVRLGDDHHMRVTFIRDGGEYRRRVDFRQNSAVSYTPISNDTWINQVLPDANYGSLTYLMVSNQSGGVRNAILYSGAEVNGALRSATLQLNVGSAALGSVLVYKLNSPSLFGFCNENTLTWNNWQGCFGSQSFVAGKSSIAANSALVVEVTSAISAQGGLHAFRITTSDIATNRWFHSRESVNNRPYLVTTSSP